MNLFSAALAAALAQAGADAPAVAQPPTPRLYQTDSARADPFTRAIQLAAAIRGQPPTDRARRSAMVNAIRRTLTGTGSTLDKADLEQTLQAIGRIPRERFVPKIHHDLAYVSTPIGIGYDQTITDSYIVALMTAAVHPRTGDKVLDVGTGSGYQAAVLSLLAQSVVSIEIIAPLAHSAAKLLRQLAYRNITVIAGDGFAGVPRRAPFDAIIVAAGAKAIPPALLDQLKPGGRLVMPIGPSQYREQLLLVTKSSSGALTQCSLGSAAFVPFTGALLVTPPDPIPLDGLPLCYGVPVT